MRMGIIIAMCQCKYVSFSDWRHGLKSMPLWYQLHLKRWLEQFKMPVPTGVTFLLKLKSISFYNFQHVHYVIVQQFNLFCKTFISVQLFIFYLSHVISD